METNIKEGQAKSFMAAGEDAERGAGIAHVSQAEQAIDDRDRVMQRYRAVDDDLGQLIEDDNGKISQVPTSFHFFALKPLLRH